MRVFRSVLQILTTACSLAQTSEVYRGCFEAFRGSERALRSPGTMITDFCPGPSVMEPFGAFLLQKGEVGTADSRHRTARQAAGKPREALAGAGQARTAHK